MNIREEFHATHGEKLSFKLRGSTSNDVWTVIKVNSTKKGCFVELYKDDNNGRLIAVFWESARKQKPIAYYYRNDDARKQAVMRFIERHKGYIDSKAEQKAKNQQGNAGIEVGDVFRASWGYDQTNIDYYQVTKLVGKASVEVREIGQLRSYDAQDRGKCAPEIDNFIGEPMRKKIRWYGDTPNFKIASYTSASLVKPQIINGVKLYNKSEWTAYH